MSDQERESMQAQAILEMEVFQEVCKELEDSAIREIRSAMPGDLINARAKLLAVAEVQNALKARIDRYQLNVARSGKVPLA